MLRKPKFTAHPGKQTEFLASTIDWVFFGGARGGTKTFSLAWKAALQPRTWKYYDIQGKPVSREEAQLLRRAGQSVQVETEKVSIDFPDYIGILIRRTFPQLETNLKPECDKLYRLYGGVWQERNKCYVFPSGAKIYLKHCKDREAVWNFIGGNYHWMGIDEANLFPEEWVDKLSTSVRTTNPELKPQICLTSNPGHIGHIWLKRRFVDRCTPIDVGEPVYNELFDIWYQPKKTAPPYIDEEGISYQFIPSTVFDNPSILENDPAYVRRLKKLNPVLRAMWLEGRWDIFQGMYFDMWSILHHVIPREDFVWQKDFDVDTHTLYRFYDYGTKAPFVCLFAALDKKGKLVVFDEIVMTGLSASKQAKYVNKYTAKKYGLTAANFEDEIADPAYWIRGGENERGMRYSPRDFYDDNGIYLRKGLNDRKVGAKIVYDALTLPGDEDGEALLDRKQAEVVDQEPPYLRFTDNCKYCLETFPTLPASEFDPEDVDTKGEDHAYDAVRYGCTMVLNIRTDKKEEKKGWRYDLANHNLPHQKNEDVGKNLWKAI